MSDHVDPQQLLEWCRVPADQLVGHPGLRVPFRMVEDAREMGRLMAEELVELVEAGNAEGRPTRVIVPCGPSAWYAPWTATVNARGVSLGRLTVFHMDECLDWQGRPLPNHPYSFRGNMERDFYGPVDPALAVPEENRHWLTPSNMDQVAAALAEAPIDLTLGGWGQDGHLAYNQARRNPWSPIDVEDLRASTIRFQENNADTIVALAHRTFGGAWQLVPPLSITLGMKECLSARRCASSPTPARGSRPRCAWRCSPRPRSTRSPSCSPTPTRSSRPRARPRCTPSACTPSGTWH